MKGKDKIANPEKLPGSLIQSERLLAKQQREVALRIEKAKERAKGLENELLFAKAMKDFDGKQLIVKSEAKRRTIIDLFLQYGIGELNGVDVEKIVVVVG